MRPVSIQSRKVFNKKRFSPQEQKLGENEPLFAKKQNNSALFRFTRPAYSPRFPSSALAPTPTPSLRAPLPFPGPRDPLPCWSESGTGSRGVGSGTLPGASPGRRAQKAARHPRAARRFPSEGSDYFLNSVPGDPLLRPPPAAGTRGARRSAEHRPQRGTRHFLRRRDPAPTPGKH